VSTIQQAVYLINKHEGRLLWTLGLAGDNRVEAPQQILTVQQLGNVERQKSHLQRLS
jgi:hypothetical protein